MKIAVRYIEHNGTHYLRLEDVVQYLRDFGSTEERDVRDRVNKAASAFLDASKEWTERK